MSASELLRQRIRKHHARVVVVGLGYVGLPLAVRAADSRFAVTGFDLNRTRVRALQAGCSYVPDVPSRTVRRLVRQRCLTVTHHRVALHQAEVVVICVPTPLLNPKQPDLSFLRQAIRMVARSLRGPALVILESTTYPGTTDRLMRSEFQRAGHRLDHDVFLAFSPERIDPGNRRFPVEAIPKLVGGVTPASTRLATLFYRQVLRRVVPVSSSTVAETAKLLENTFRSINIALANEFALLCHALGVDVWEVIRAAKTKPFGFMPFYPGPGVGGHCIPSDPIYLTWRARARGVKTPLLIESAAAINARMPQHIVQRLQQLLAARRRPLTGAKILIVGVAYKRDVNDTRESPALEIFEALVRRGARVTYHDPLVPSIQMKRVRWQSRALHPAFVRGLDCVVIVTDHSSVDYGRLGRYASLIFDTRNAMRDVRSRPATVVPL